MGQIIEEDRAKFGEINNLNRLTGHLVKSPHKVDIRRVKDRVNDSQPFWCMERDSFLAPLHEFQFNDLSGLIQLCDEAIVVLLGGFTIDIGHKVGSGGGVYNETLRRPESLDLKGMGQLAKE